MCASPPSTATSARRRTSRLPWRSLPPRTSRRRRRPGGNRRLGRVAAEVVPVLHEIVQEGAPGWRRAERGVNGLRNVEIGVGPAADEFDVQLAVGFIIADAFDGG